MPVAAARLVSVAARAFGDNPPDRIAVAVSGGSDSLAALHLFHRAAEEWAAAGQGRQVLAVTVDHRLRPEAAAEAAHVGRLCARLGIAHEVLVWDHGALSGNVMDLARRARYRLIADWAADRGVADVVLAHTADDQAETFLMGLARQAGLDGLSGMRPEWRQGGIRFHRPFLSETRADLRGFLTGAGQVWLEDPSNENPAYQRVRTRRVLRGLSALGINPAGLARVASHLAEARAALQALTAEAAARLVREDAGSLTLDRAGVLALPAEVQRRLATAALLWLNGAEYPPRGPEILRLLAAMAAGRDATLAGCRMRSAGPEVRLMREPKAVAACRAAPGTLWDGRWQVIGPEGEGAELRALGEAGLRACKDWRASGLPREVLLVTPAVWRGQTLIAAPPAGQPNGWDARISAGFDQFILSH